jgi:hypothetical protein
MTSSEARSALTENQIRLLVAATEDWIGLYEAVWELRTSHPNLPEVDLILAARAALTTLVDRGLIYLCFLKSRPATPQESTEYAARSAVPTGADNWDTDIEDPVPADQADSVLADESNYRPPENRDGKVWFEIGYYSFAATDEGEAMYRTFSWDAVQQNYIAPS